MSDSASLGDWIRRRRKALDLTREALAQQIGCAVVTIRKIETDERRPSREMAVRLAGCLAIPDDECAAFLKAARAELAVDQLPMPSGSAAKITNLPIPLSSFVGRQYETAHLKSLLGQTRLLTLAGVGGSGKTRLAIQVATNLIDTFKDGVWWIELAGLADESLVPNTIAKVLGIQERPGESMSQTLISVLRNKQLLFVIDNCEHLVGVCAQLADTLVSHCPQVKILATSRESLNITGERVYLVSTLAVPALQDTSPWNTWPEYEGVKLFIERANAVDSSFTLTKENAPSVLRICQQLDGMPLALELAAARVRVLSVHEIATRLDDRFSLLTLGSRTAPPRQQTLRATIDWSYDLLTEAERVLLRRLAIFAGRFTFEAAERVCAPIQAPMSDLLSHLVDKSLVLVERDVDNTQYRLLETIRQYAHEKLLASGEENYLRAAHLDFFTNLVGSAESQVVYTRHVGWMSRLESAHDNVRAALRWALEQGHSVAALRLSGGMGEFWDVRGYWSEGRQWLEQALALSREVCASTNASSAVRGWCAQALSRAGSLARQQCDFASARTLLEQSHNLYRELDRRNGLTYVLGNLAAVAFEQGEYATTQAHYKECLELARGLRNTQWISASLFGLGLVAYHQGEYAAAQTLLEECLKLCREAEHTFDIPYPLNALGNLANLQGNYTAARIFYEECLALRRELGYKRGVAATLNDMANVRAKQGDYASARTLYEESLTLYRELGNKRGMASVLSGLACLAQAQGQLLTAAHLLSAVETLLAQIHARLDEPQLSDKQRTIATLRTQLDALQFDAAWEQGSRLTLEEMIALAYEIP